MANIHPSSEVYEACIHGNVAQCEAVPWALMRLMLRRLMRRGGIRSMHTWLMRMKRLVISIAIDYNNNNYLFTVFVAAYEACIRGNVAQCEAVPWAVKG